ncbi:hypothetical protein FSP39_012386 [Pinctada imbricata]|uniref:Uncharacterized protein n=1 Tax=Pinctada imbricata TaxID=66713 RepID=A0AA89BM93_PINIB|nr:hypothetical protein FSP39_012386 [Pinctada imbricata]
MAQGSCYCCAQPQVNKMDIDSALDELGMLSSVTTSRRQFLSEQKRTASDSCLEDLSSSSRITRRFQVVKIDPKYVTGVTMNSKSQHVWIPLSDDSPPQTKNLPNSSSSASDFGMKYREMTSSEEASQNRRRCIRMSRIRAGRYKRFQKPYEVPWRINQSLPETDLRLAEQSDLSQSKSNTSSPVKGVKATSDPRLTRSRSLGNIDFSKLNISDIIVKNSKSHEREEMESVSHHLENLHVSDGV